MESKKNPHGIGSALRIFSLVMLGLMLVLPAGFADVIKDGSKHAPVVTGISGPSNLDAGQTGTWQVTAYDPEGGSLTYAVVWGDEGTGIFQAKPNPIAAEQTAAFTHIYYNAGTYTPTFTVTDNGSLTAQTSSTVVVGSTDTAPPTVSSTHSVTGNAVSISANAVDPSGISEMKIHLSLPPESASILADRVVAACESSPCSYTGTSSAGKYYYYVSAKDASPNRNEGVTDRTYFGIVGDPGGNRAPTISGVSGPTNLDVGQTGTWSVSASDPEGSPLSYSVAWGDANTNDQAATAQVSQRATLTHVYYNSGAFVPTFTVTDDHHLTAQTSLSVAVGQASSDGRISVQIFAEPKNAKVSDSVYVSGVVTFEQSPSMRALAASKSFKVVTSLSDNYALAGKPTKKAAISLKAADDDIWGQILDLFSQQKASDGSSSKQEASVSGSQQGVNADSVAAVPSQQATATAPSVAAIANAGATANSQERVDYITLKEGESSKVSAYFAVHSSGVKIASIRVYEEKSVCPPATSPPMGMPCRMDYVLVGQAYAKVSVSGEVLSPPPQTGATIVLFKGWNMVSVPSANAKVDMNTVASDCGANPHAWRLTASGYAKESMLSPGYGYWIKAGKNCNIDVQGSTGGQIVLQDLFQGWNLVGALDQTVTISNYSGTCSITSGPWYYSNDATSDRASPYIYSSSLVPGQAYWIKVAGACRLGGANADVPPAPPA